jgi:pseudouridine synthase
VALERIQKILARAGIASRRAAERLMVEGRVSVNGQVIDRLGAHADLERDHIKVDGKLLRIRTPAKLYLLAFKPRDMITTLRDPEGRPCIADLLRGHGIRARVFPVGRLDWDADGLLLLTNDGELANAVMHPRRHVPKVYRVRVKGNPNERDLDRVRRGVVLEPGLRTLPAEIVVEAEEETGTTLRVTLVEGRQNQVKRMFERIGHPVRRLRRVRIGPIGVGKLKPGQIRPLTERELSRLRQSLQEGGAAVPAKVLRRSRPALRRKKP